MIMIMNLHDHNYAIPRLSLSPPHYHDIMLSYPNMFIALRLSDVANASGDQTGLPGRNAAALQPREMQHRYFDG